MLRTISCRLQYTAACNGKWEIVNLLLERCADHLSCYSNGHTLLHLAAKKGSKDTVNLLLDLGMDINAKNKELQTAIHRAASYGKW